MRCRPTPCEACPYRRDVPSGVWDHSEYEKLRDYDKPTHEQPIAYFACHANPEFLCNGWVVVHENQGRGCELLALRVLSIRDEEIPREIVPLFVSGNEAADHGQRDIEEPGMEAREMIAKLRRRYPRLQVES